MKWGLISAIALVMSLLFANFSEALATIIGFCGVVILVASIVVAVRKKKHNQPVGKILISIIIISFFVIGIAGSMTDSSEVDTTTPGDQVQEPGNNEPPVEEPEPLTPEEELALFITSTIGDKTNHSKDDYKNRLNDLNLEDKHLFLEVIGNDNLSKNMIRGGMLRTAEDIFSEIFTEFDYLEEVTLSINFPMVDSYGNEKLSRVMLIWFTREQAEKVNWSSFDRDNFPVVADSYWVHPALQ